MNQLYFVNLGSLQIVKLNYHFLALQHAINGPRFFSVPEEHHSMIYTVPLNKQE